MSDTPAATEELTHQQKQTILQNALFTRQALVNSLLDDKRDLNYEAGYPNVITTDMYQKMYDREGIASRVVTMEPEESWAVDPAIIENKDKEKTEFEKAWISLEKKFNLFAYLQRADELSGIGHYGVLLLGLNDGSDLDKPIADASESKDDSVQRELLFVRAFPEQFVKIVEYEKDVGNPRYGHPVMYSIDFNDPNTTPATEEATVTVTKKVHWTRILHLADNRQSSEVFGTPRMKDVYNRLLDLRKVLGGSGEMFWKGAFPGYSFEVDPAQTAAGAELDTDSVRAEFERYSNSLQRYIALTGVSAKSLAPQVSDPNPQMTAALKAIAFSKGVPWRLFIGSEEAKMASINDKDTWRERVKHRQHKYLTPWVVTPFINRLIALGVLPQVKDPEEGFIVLWPDLAKQTDKEKAEVAARRTDALSKYAAAGLDVLIPPEQFFTIVMDMTPEEAEAIVKAAKQMLLTIDRDDDEDVDEDVTREDKNEISGE